jgi:N,N'-diacetyllegionaminate synthase
VKSHKTLNFGDIEVGEGRPCVVVAEIGINHNGDMALAREQIDAAAESGAHIVKFQNYHTEDFISDTTLMLSYTSQSKPITEPQYNLFKRCELSLDNLVEIKEYCDKRGIEFQSTPTSARGIHELLEIGANSLKNGSDYLGNLELIRMMGETGLPTVLSTGMATVAEIDDAVRCFRETGNQSLMLLHCVSSYPTPPEQANLARITVLQSAFGCPVGFSDHTEGNLAAAISVTLGACMIEKHFTLSRDLPGPDHWFSSTPDEMAELVRNVAVASKLMGSPVLGPTESEALGRRDFRLSCVSVDALPSGHRLTDTDITYRRPGTGIPPSQAYLLKGRVLKHSAQPGHIFSPEDFE